MEGSSIIHTANTLGRSSGAAVVKKAAPRIVVILPMVWNPPYTLRQRRQADTGSTGRTLRLLSAPLCLLRGRGEQHRSTAAAAWPCWNNCRGRCRESCERNDARVYMFQRTVWSLVKRTGSVDPQDLSEHLHSILLAVAVLLCDKVLAHLSCEQICLVMNILCS